MGPYVSPPGSWAVPQNTCGAGLGGFLSVLSMMWEAMLLGQETQYPPHLLRAGFCRGGLASSRLEAAATIVVSEIPVLASPFP